MIKKMWMDFWHTVFGDKRVYIVTKTVRVAAVSRLEAINKAKMQAANDPSWVWDVVGETDDLF